MNPRIGWSLAFLALVAGWFGGRWQGLALAFTLVVFWLLLQFNRSVKVMRLAAQSPVGHVDSAVMLHAKLVRGLPMLKIVTLTGSLGRHLGDAPETWAWGDDSGSEVHVVFEKGRCERWRLSRPAEAVA